MINCKPLATLRHIELGQVIQSMHGYRGTLSQANKLIFDLTYKKVLNSAKSVKLDGMGMKSIIEALSWKIIRLLEIGEFTLAVHYQTIALKVERELKKFQIENGPKIKDAACGPVQTA